jgi:hypothetical protein
MVITARPPVQVELRELSREHPNEGDIAGSQRLDVAALSSYLQDLKTD